MMGMPFFRGNRETVPDTQTLSLSQRMGWSAQRGIQHLGTPGVLAVGILAMVLVFYFSGIVAAQKRLETARSDAAALQQRMNKASFAAGGQLSPSEQLAAFYRSFPAETDSPQWLGKVFASASSRGLLLDEGDYDAKPEKAGSLVRFRMTLPLKGEYAQIRKFLTGLPAEVPVVALEQVQFERQKIGDPLVDAKLKLVLFLERTP